MDVGLVRLQDCRTGFHCNVFRHLPELEIHIDASHSVNGDLEARLDVFAKPGRNHGEFVGSRLSVRDRIAAVSVGLRFTSLTGGRVEERHSCSGYHGPGLVIHFSDSGAI